ncbi:uncharacterized protein [Solanum tuberosum]|uniref:uncharacterized protein n=1 Tax=Solanum tuberosum TaxID=4113 RepID=UPI00073A3273|nr:PREDICTED: uncharacterized protein LOC107058653 [Solanum tuberosum]
MEKRSNDVPKSQFMELLRYWNSEKFQEKERETYDPPSLKEFLWLQEKENPIDHTRIQMKSTIAEMENIKMQQNEDGNETIDAFPSIMGSKHPGCLRFYGIGLLKLL